MTRINRPAGGPSQYARDPNASPRARRIAAQNTIATNTAAPFTTERGTGRTVLATDETLEVAKGTNQLRARLAKLLRRTADGIDVSVGKTITGKSGSLEMVPAPRVSNLDPTATLAQVIDKVNELLDARRKAGEQTP